MDFEEKLVVFFALVSVAVFGFVVGSSITQHDINQELVKRGIKQYNTITGVLEWKDANSSNRGSDAAKTKQ